MLFEAIPSAKPRDDVATEDAFCRADERAGGRVNSVISEPGKK
jgi:hypothetical protein